MAYCQQGGMRNQSHFGNYANKHAVYNKPTSYVMFLYSFHLLVVVINSDMLHFFSCGQRFDR